MRHLFLILLILIPVAAAPLDKKQITDRIAANQAAGDDSEAAEAIAHWKDALVAFEAAEQSSNAAKKLREELARLDPLPTPSLPDPVPAKSTLKDREDFLNEVVSMIDANEIRRKELADQSEQSPERTASLTEEAARIRAELQDLTIPAPAAGEVETARYQKAVQNKRRLESKLEEILAEQELLKRASEVYFERVKRLNTHTGELKNLKEKIRGEIQELKKQEALETREVIRSMEDEFSDIPVLAKIVQEAAALRSEKSSLQESLIEAREYGERVGEVRRRIDEQFSNAKRRIRLLEDAKLGVDDETGMLLRQQRSRLPSVDELSADLRENLERAAKAQLAQLSLSDQISEVPAVGEDEIESILGDHPKISRARVDELLNQRSEALIALSSDYRKLNEELTKGTEAAKLTIAEIGEYSSFIDERLLWIKSTTPIHVGEPLEEWGRIVGLFGPTTLGRLFDSFRNNWFEKIIPAVLAVLFAAGIFLKRRFFRGVLKRSSEAAARRNCTSLVPTLQNIGAAVLLSLWVPLIIFVFSEIVDEPTSWKVGLRNLSVFLFVTSLLIKFSREDGLFVAHLKMHPDRSALSFRNLKWLVPIAAPIVFLVSALSHSEVDTSSGRVMFILGMLVTAVVCHHLFHPNRSVLQKEGRSSTFTRICYFFIMAIPVIFIVGAGLGYFASVLTLRTQVGYTVLLLVFAFFLIRFLTRWTLVSRRGLAITQALRRREVAMAEREREEEGAEKAPDLPSLEEVKAEAVNVVEVEEQTMQLLRLATYAAVFFGFWAIWSSTLPALSVLDKVTLWGGGQVESSAEAKSLVPNLTGSSEAPGDKVKKMVTPSDDRVSLQDLLLTVVFFALTFIAARNIPGLLSLTLFSRINLGPGGNFALTTTVRYLIVLVGVVLALSQIGITWGKVQWLAAAITLGIGFGLQEIFANFVAGIILLFERPIRLGDVVTVRDISGRVTQIKIRATTIQQFNNRELLVPNKEFITSQLVNWTLKDSVLRFEVNVGIAYGSDTGKATEVLEGILRDHPNVLDEPKPDVLFVSFGNSTLDFVVRGFVANVDHLISAQSELHYQIDQAFREAGIEIAFPQQDIHVRSLPEGLEPKISS